MYPAKLFFLNLSEFYFCELRLPTMGCTSSKQLEANVVNPYRPSATSFSILDVYAIQEPWLNPPESEEERKPSLVPPPILEKLKSIEDAPHSWDEVSKVLEDLKPKLLSSAAVTNVAKSTPPSPPPQLIKENPPAMPKAGSLRRKSFSFHTLEELEARTISNSKPAEKDSQLNHEPRRGWRADSVKKFPPPKMESENGAGSDLPKSLKENIFILRDKKEREQEGKSAGFVNRNPLSEFPENCPPGGGDTVVLYTTSLGGIRRTYEDCNRVRSIMENHQIVFDERDVSLHGGFLKELKELLGDQAAFVPRVFVKGRYLGGAEEVAKLNDTGRLARILNWAGVDRGSGRVGCEGCGGARFVPCLECGGSCWIRAGDQKRRCGECNENGLVGCHLCAL